MASKVKGGLSRYVDALFKLNGNPLTWINIDGNYYSYEDLLDNDPSLVLCSWSFFIFNACWLLGKYRKG